MWGIAINLSLDNVAVQNITHSTYKVQDQLMEVFDMWRRLETRPFKLKTIVEVLESEGVGENALASNLRKKYKFRSCT